MKLNLFILTLFSGFILNSQNIPVDIILKNSDTLTGTMKVRFSPYKEKVILPSSFNETVKFSDDFGMRKIKGKEIKELWFEDIKGNVRKFVSLTGYKHHIVEEVFAKKVWWFRHYSFDLYHGHENVSDEIYDEKYQKFKMGVFSGYKRKLRAFSKNDPEISEFIRHHDVKRKENILEVILMYESKLSED